MGRFRDNTDSGEETLIDMSPLIDCVFILLIFFIVTTTFVEETGVEVDKPQAASSVNLEKQSIIIALTEEGEVIFNEKPIGFSGIQPLIRRKLQREELPVIVEADRSADAGDLMRVIDEAKIGAMAMAPILASSITRIKSPASADRSASTITGSSSRCSFRRISG